MFQIFGAVRRAERTKSGSASLTALSVFQPMFKASAQRVTSSSVSVSQEMRKKVPCSSVAGVAVG